jgi:hypothetical protein
MYGTWGPHMQMDATQAFIGCEGSIVCWKQCHVGIRVGAIVVCSSVLCHACQACQRLQLQQGASFVVHVHMQTAYRCFAGK